MAFFWTPNKKKEEIELSYIERLVRLEQKVSIQQSDILDLTVSLSNMRDKVIKRFKFPSKEEEPDKDLYNGMFPKQ